MQSGGSVYYDHSIFIVKDIVSVRVGCVCVACIALVAVAVGFGLMKREKKRVTKRVCVFVPLMRRSEKTGANLK